MRPIVLAAAFLLSAQAVAIADEQYELRFVDENNKPLQNASFYFYELHGEKLVKATYRAHKLDATASIKLATLPPEFEFGVETQDHFYYGFWAHTEKPLVAGVNVIRVEQFGSLSLVFAHVDKEVASEVRNELGNTSPRSLVMVIWRRDNNGEWEPVKGVGLLGLRDGATWRIDGLAPGAYKCEMTDARDLKTGEQRIVYWAYEDIIVSKGNVSRMEGLKALAPR